MGADTKPDIIRDRVINWRSPSDQSPKNSGNPMEDDRESLYALEGEHGPPKELSRAHVGS